MTKRIPRWAARAPIPLYRAGLGFLLGTRLMMVEHRGRVSGRPRLVVLEVVDREPQALIAVSGYGRAAQWYRNVLADPRVRVWTGRRRAVPAQARTVPPGDVPALLTEYRRRHRRAAKALGRTLTIPELTSGAPIPADIAARLPLVRIELSGGSGRLSPHPR